MATSQFCVRGALISQYNAPSLVSSLRLYNLEKLTKKFAEFIEVESQAVEEGDVDGLASLFDNSIIRAHNVQTPEQDNRHYDLFSTRYAGTYFSYRQTMEIDSIRYAIDELKVQQRISEEQWNTLLAALCIAISRCSNSTGHFAQALYPKQSNINKIITKRRKDVFDEWLQAINHVIPLGRAKWRQSNQAFNNDAIDLLSDLQGCQKKPKVIYADPPYTQDQYSRYYHILETAVLYDHPTCSGKGLYRPGRATSAFSLASKVESALDKLVMSAAQLQSCFVLSYPEDGLLRDSVSLIPKMIHNYFGKQPDCVRLPHRHSTMGASKGQPTHEVTEIIYRVSR